MQGPPESRENYGGYAVIMLLQNKHRYYNSSSQLETILSTRRYLTGSQLTEADVRLFTTLIRFDKVYTLTFKVGTYSWYRQICASFNGVVN